MNPGIILDRIVSFATGILGRWKLYAALLGLVVASNALSYCKGHSNGVESERAAQAEAGRIQAEKARKADAKARDAVEAVEGDVEAANDRARDAADGSDDPLAKGLEALR